MEMENYIAANERLECVKTKLKFFYFNIISRDDKLTCLVKTHFQTIF